MLQYSVSEANKKAVDCYMHRYRECLCTTQDVLRLIFYLDIF